MRTLPISLGVLALFLIGYASIREPDADHGCAAVDGDSLTCPGYRIRLNGIDAPEIGPCRRGRRCVDGDPWAARANLEALIGGPGEIDVMPLGEDRYGRTIANIRVGDLDVSCAQLAGGFAIYRADWDERGETRRRCPQ